MKSRLACLLFVVLASAGTAAPASAGPTKAPPKPPGPVVNSWSLMPTGTDPSQPGSRVFLSYDVAPGSTVRDSVTLWNYSNVPLTFQIYATDAFNTPSGAFEALPTGKQPSATGSWITLAWNELTVKPQGKVDIPLTLTVPPGARPGDHAGAILAANQVEGTTANGKVVNLDRRTGSRVYIRVRGPLQPGLVIENVHSVYRSRLNPLGGSLDVTYTVRNAGNVRLSARQRLRVGGPGGVLSTKHAMVAVPELLPGNAVTFHKHFTSVPALLRDRLQIRLEPASPDADVTSVPPVTRLGHAWALPWSLVALALGIWLARRSLLVIRERRRAVTAAAARSQDRLMPVP